MQCDRMRWKNGLKKALTLSFDDGTEQDIPFVEMMKQNGVKGTFNVNTGLLAPEGTVYPEGQVHRVMTEKQLVSLFKDSGMEVAVHGLNHPFLERLPSYQAVNEVIEDRKNIEALFGVPCRGMAYPFGTFNDSVVDTLAACGICYSRTTVSTLNFNVPVDWLRMPATCHYNDEHLPELTEKFVNETPDKAPWLFYLWGHTFEFEGRDNWNVIEKFLKKVGNREDVWYATNIEIYDYVQAFLSLQETVDGKVVYNPSAISVWVKSGDTAVEIKPGQTVTL